MRLYLAILALTLFSPTWAVPIGCDPRDSNVSFLTLVAEHDNVREDDKLWKRKGGGGASLGGPRSGSSSGGGSSGTARGGNHDNTGGSTKTGSSPAPAYGRDRYYGGGTTTPYPAGQEKGDTIPFFLDDSSLVFWPGLWRTGAHLYAYTYPYRFYNESARENQTKLVLYGCADNQPCGCDINNSTEYMSSLGNGSCNGLNKSIVNMADYQGNSTFPNGTTAAGGTNDSGSTSDAIHVVTEVGFELVAAIVLATVFAA